MIVDGIFKVILVGCAVGGFSAVGAGDGVGGCSSIIVAAVAAIIVVVLVLVLEDLVGVITVNVENVTGWFCFALHIC